MPRLSPTDPLSTNFYRPLGIGTPPDDVDWRNPIGAPGYEVSVAGHVRRIGGALMWRFQKTKGYVYVSLTVSTGKRRHFRVNRLVAQAFHGDPPTGCHQVAHLDDDKLNNAASNLEYQTPAQNMAALNKRLRAQRAGLSAVGEAASPTAVRPEGVVPPPSLSLASASEPAEAVSCPELRPW